MRNRVIFLDYQVFVHRAGNAVWRVFDVRPEGDNLLCFDKKTKVVTKQTLPEIFDYLRNKNSSAHQSVRVWDTNDELVETIKFNDGMPINYTILNMIHGVLCKVGVDDFTTIILANDRGKSWRKKHEKAYKGDRAEKRALSGIDWKYIYDQANQLYEQLLEVTDFQPAFHFWFEDDPEAGRKRRWALEADDFMAAAPLYYTNSDIILVTIDADLEQLFLYNYDDTKGNVYIFSPHQAHLGKNVPYKPILDKTTCFKLLSKKIEKEASDNLTTEVCTDEAYETREEIVSLLHLPQWIKDIAFKTFSTYEPKLTDIDSIPFKSIRSKWDNIYKTDKILTYEYCQQLREKRNKRKKKK